MALSCGDLNVLTTPQVIQEIVGNLERLVVEALQLSS